jgi:Transposase, Mutator family
MTEWLARPLDEVYPVIFIDALVVKVHDGQGMNKPICALAMWRTEIDDTGQDPREELAFQNQLTDYADLLRQQSGSVTKEWKPGAPPAEWAMG